MIDRRQALATLAGGALAAPQAVSQQRRKPNVIVILADDLGFGEVLGGAAVSIPTPNVESIARQGVRFENGYVSCPVCAPTRAGLLTGRYQQRFGFEFNPGPVGQEEDQFGLPREEPTLAERMKALGYRTGMVGKWHLGLRPGFRPLDRGFEDFFGFLAGAHSYRISRAIRFIAEPSQSRRRST
jgi:arylsulfatase A-like enzyme